MKNIITEEMKFRQRVVEYAIKKIIMPKQQEDIIPADNKCKDGEKNMMEQ